MFEIYPKKREMNVHLLMNPSSILDKILSEEIIVCMPITPYGHFLIRPLTEYPDDEPFIVYRTQQGHKYLITLIYDKHRYKTISIL